MLALPPVAAWATRPFISAYWSWAGIMNSLEGSFRSAVDKVTDTWLAPSWICYAVLIVHIVIGLFFAYVGVKKSRWE